MTTITDTIIKEIEENQEVDLKFPRQAELEEKMRGMGVDRFWSSISKAQERGQETEIGAVRRLMNSSIGKIIEGIEEFFAECEAGKAGRKHTAYPYLKKIEPEVAALITSRAVLDGVAKGSVLVALARAVAQLIEDELAFRAFKEADPQAFSWLVRREKAVDGSSYSRQRQVMHYNAKARGVTWEEWDNRTQVLVGSKLIEIMIAKTGLVIQTTRSVGPKKEEVVIEATPETVAWINEENNRCEAMSPVYLPTIIPPRPWTSPFEGGYWTPRVRRLALVKTHSRAYLEELAEQDMPDLYDGVNAMQNTAWCINNRMLDTIRELWTNGSTLGGIPSASDVPLPTKPAFLEMEIPKEEWSEQQMTQFKEWKHQATDIYAYNAKLKSMRLQFVKVLMVAEMFEEEEEIYFPHQLDFRGRAYAVPMFLNPQGSDVAKGMLTFANAVAIHDQEAADWLAIHGSNSWGYDKETMEARVQWVQDHEAEILACAADPFNNKFWSDADKPFQFLAFCFEWQEFKEHGFGYLSSLPIAMDGSCNGLQNFSAMLRDEIGGAAVNLVPQLKPADIYNKVAERVLLRVEADAKGSDPEKSKLATGWIKLGVTRKVCKRPVMTLAYGAKAFGFKTQVFEDTIHPCKYEMGENFPWEDSGWSAASYMGELIWDCVGEVVVAARQAMDWLQKAARAASKEGLPVRWETPDGLPVLQAYPKPLTKRIDMTFNGHRHYLTVSTGQSRELDKAKQANGISPNWIHSMDASHMRATVRRAWAEGIRSFSLVHDSYGTQAGSSWALAKFLREEFVEMYSNDVLEKFRDELALQLPEGAKLDEIPPKGTLDLNLVLESKFFFA